MGRHRGRLSIRKELLSRLLSVALEVQSETPCLSLGQL